MIYTGESKTRRDLKMSFGWLSMDLRWSTVTPSSGRQWKKMAAASSDEVTISKAGNMDQRL